MNAEKSDPMSPLNPEYFGWKIGPTGIYEPFWFDGEVAPLIAIDTIADDEPSDDENDGAAYPSEDDEAND
uniref:Uncharacterized protein n=1 Tax=Timema bartmani TaxID=61472 RepID=A0A7R9I8D7_9NEOP|nr:unnamed protein product [Timema bartmani]